MCKSASDVDSSKIKGLAFGGALSPQRFPNTKWALPTKVVYQGFDRTSYIRRYKKSTSECDFKF